MSFEYLGRDDVLTIASGELAIPVRVLRSMARLDVLDSALFAPASGFDGVDLYQDLETKVAILGYRLARSHGLPDANKRTALLAMVEFGERNGLSWPMLDPDETLMVMVSAAAGAVSEQMFIDWVVDVLSTERPRTSGVEEIR